MYLDDNGNYEIKHLIATAKKNNYYSDKIFQATWSSSNSNVVTVIPINKYASTYDKNLLKNVPLQDFTGEAILIPKSAGQATITVSYGGKTDTCLVTVSAPGQDNREQDNKQGETDPSLPMPNPVNPGETFTEPNTGATYVITNDGGVRFESTNNPKATKVVIPDYITIKGKNYPVTSISDNAFSKNKSLKNLVVGKNVAVIGKKAFNSATNLRKVDMKSSNVEKIESSAFKNCKNLRSLKINANTLKTVAKGAFKGSRKKVKVTVYAKDKKSFNSCVKKLTKGGLKTASYKYKKK